MLDIPPPQPNQKWSESSTWKMLTRLIDAVRGIGKARGDGYVNVKWEGNTPVFGVNVDRILRRSPRIGGGGGGSGYPECSIVCDVAIPANSLAEIVSYNAHADIYTVQQPSADNISLAKLIIVASALAARTVGTGYLDFGDITLLTDDAVVAGDILGTQAGDWKAHKGATVGLEVASVITGSVAYVTMTNVGAGYAYDPAETVTLTWTNGVGAATPIRMPTGFATIAADGTISGVTMLDSGEGIEALTVTFSAPSGGGTTATGTVVIAGSVDQITVTTGGDYASTPTVTVTAATGDDGTDCTATAHLTGRVLTSITIDTPGKGFVLTPTVTISGSGGGAATARVA